VAIKRDEDFIPVNGNIPLKAGDNIWLVAQPSVASSLC
jgi:Trk K+ transport system NAD-binding subunit